MHQGGGFSPSVYGSADEAVRQYEKHLDWREKCFYEERFKHEEVYESLERIIP